MSRHDPPHRILLLDDEPLILLDLEFAVHDAGCVAVTAMDSEEALGLLDGSSISAAILDVSLGANCTCAPVIGALVARGIPYVLHSADVGRLEPWARELGGLVVAKPAPSSAVVECALGQVASRAIVG